MKKSEFKKYPKYKPSGVEWIGEIPEGWSVNRLKNCLESEQNGFWGEEEKGDKNDKVCIRVADFDRDFDKLNKTGNTTRNIKLQDYEKRKLKLGDLLIEKSGGGELTPVGRVGFFDWEEIEAVCANFIARLRIKDSHNSRFFFYLFKALYKNRLNLKSIKQTTGIQNLDTYDYFSELIATPQNGSEQTAIANYLDDKTAKIDSLIEKKKKLIELFKEERTAVINEAVTKGLNYDSHDLADEHDKKNHGNPLIKLNQGSDTKMKDSGIDWLGQIPQHWEVKKLKYVGNIVLGKMLTNDDKGGYYLKPYLRAANLQWFKVNVEDVKEMWFSEAELEKLRIEEFDLLVSEGGEVGRTCIWQKELEECFIQNSVHKITIEQNQDPLFFLYLMYYLGSIGLFESIVNRISIAHLTGEKIKDIPVWHPHKTEQHQIVQYIEAETKRIDGKIARTEKEIELLREYRTALISEVVTGKIKVC